MKLLAVLLIAFVAISCGSKEKILTVGYLQITQDPVLDIAKEGVYTALKDSGYIDKQNFRITEKNARGDLSMIPMVLLSFIPSEVDVQQKVALFGTQYASSVPIYLLCNLNIFTKDVLLQKTYVCLIIYLKEKPGSFLAP